MSEQTLALAIFYSAVSALVYGSVGVTVSRRPVSEFSALAQQAFAAWWFGLAFLQVSSAANIALWMWTDASIVTFLSLSYLGLWVLSAALGGLLYYLVYLYTGRQWLLVLIAVSYLVLFLWLLWLVNGNNPTGVAADDWSVSIQYEHEFSGATLWLLLTLILGPQMVGAGLFFALSVRMKAREQRIRALVVSTSIIIWFGSSLLATALQINDATWWPFISRILGMTAGLATYLVYDPPSRMRRWFEAGAAVTQSPRLGTTNPDGAAKGP